MISVPPMPAMVGGISIPPERLPSATELSDVLDYWLNGLPSLSKKLYIRLRTALSPHVREDFPPVRCE